MDHAGDVARHLADAYIGAHPRSGATVQDPAGTREHTSFIVHSSDGGWFRITVDQIGDLKSADLTDEELHDREWRTLG